MLINDYTANIATLKPQDDSGRRILHRRHLFFYLRVRKQSDQKLLGHVVDITSDGLMIISEQAFEEGEKLSLEIHWNDEEGKDRSLLFDARCCWTHPDINNIFHDSGFQFIDLPEKSREAILSITEQYGFND